jgi:arylsulfatase
VTTHRFKTWDWNTAPSFDEPWELYDLVADPGQTRDLAHAHPDRVAEMDAAFWQQAARFNVEPIHNLRDTAADSFKRARADFERRQGRWEYTGTVGNIPNELAPPINTMPFTVEVSLILPESDVTGAVFVFGGHMGGVGLYLNQGVPEFRMSNLAGESRSVVANRVLPAGDHRLRLEVSKDEREDGAFDYHVRMRADDQVIGEGVHAFAIPRFLGVAETFGVGIDNGASLHPAVRSDTPIAAQIKKVVFDLSAAGGLVWPIADH